VPLNCSRPCGRSTAEPRSALPLWVPPSGGTRSCLQGRCSNYVQRSPSMRGTIVAVHAGIVVSCCRNGGRDRQIPEGTKKQHGKVRLILATICADLLRVCLKSDPSSVHIFAWTTAICRRINVAGSAGRGLNGMGRVDRRAPAVGRSAQLSVGDAVGVGYKTWIGGRWPLSEPAFADAGFERIGVDSAQL
jgi:hypothetical protein